MLLAEINSNQVALFVIIPAVLWLVLILIALYHISRNSSMAFSVKVLWFIIILLAPFLGSIIYLMWGKNKKF
ncbi:PLDc N-terminal domain-containing protein [Pedobacter riviphilus]|uniref:PLDc N-terminal domain-containing protein n=1 Tax=Pedobacter riviphilus TaxID=2766984 RepID=A0ABX6THW0_9SPHI|nr:MULTISPECIES: PLDc N-terminal domain-containing protein [Pedobacter]NII84703.1 heme/copper-type cytochrome/quinol oxidase subunit 4 [Pedobacter sp. SG908]NMN38387.1 heme/copper-type cytochrome/quinol oxidase subunit 4 [Pedobacter sp. SG918]QNR84506.1 PLDc N-terminal domain-containing protein [Pedobacter riviphilus]